MVGLKNVREGEGKEGREREKRERKDMEGDGRKGAWLAGKERESLAGGSGLEQEGDDESHFEHI